MTNEPTSPRTNEGLPVLSSRLSAMLDSDPADAVRQAREIDLTAADRLITIGVRAPVLGAGAAS